MFSDGFRGCLQTEFELGTAPAGCRQTGIETVPQNGGAGHRDGAVLSRSTVQDGRREAVLCRGRKTEPYGRGSGLREGAVSPRADSRTGMGVRRGIPRHTHAEVLSGRNFGSSLRCIIALFGSEFGIGPGDLRCTGHLSGRIERRVLPNDSARIRRCRTVRQGNSFRSASSSPAVNRTGEGGFHRLGPGSRTVFRRG